MGHTRTTADTAGNQEQEWLGLVRGHGVKSLENPANRLGVG